MKVQQVTVTEHGWNGWKGKVVATLDGRRWTTLCEHKHRKDGPALACAQRIAESLRPSQRLDGTECLCPVCSEAT